MLRLLRAAIDASRALTQDEIDGAAVPASTVVQAIVDTGPGYNGKGLQLHGVTMVGDLDLEHLTVPIAVALVDCHLDGTIVLEQTSARWLSLDGCGVAGDIRGHQLSLQHSLRLTDLTLVGKLDLSHAHVAGSVQVDRAQTHHLDVERVTVGGSVALGGLVVSGGGSDGCAVNLRAVDIGGQLVLEGHRGGWLDLTRARVRDTLQLVDIQAADDRATGAALRADGVSVAGDLRLHNAALVGDGALKMVGAAIGGDLWVSRVVLHSAGSAASLLADRIAVGGNVRLGVAADGHRGLVVNQRISLVSATVSGSVELDHVEADAPVALQADRLRCAGNLALRPGNDFGGGIVRLAGAEVGGQLEIGQCGRTAGAVALTGATTVEYTDEGESSWPPQGRLALDGFSYQRILDTSDEPWRLRLRWLRQQDDGTGTRWNPVPYTQLAGIYRAEGRSDAAKQIGIARERDRIAFGRPPRWRRALSAVLRRATLYGFEPWRLAVLSLPILVVCSLTFDAAADRGWFVTRDGGVSSADCAPSVSPCFSAPAYVLDTFVPLVDLDQRSTWTPRTHGWVGRGLEAVCWLAIAYGWLASTLLALSLSRLARDNP